eukprot:14293426-Ditylum_brightwellii.AAC.1
MEQKAVLQDIKHKQHELISRYYLGEDEFVQLHLRDRERKADYENKYEIRRVMNQTKLKSSFLRLERVA